jgi:hypothetical protein
MPITVEEDHRHPEGFRAMLVHVRVSSVIVMTTNTRAPPREQITANQFAVL